MSNQKVTVGGPVEIAASGTDGKVTLSSPENEAAIPVTPVV